MSQLVDIYNKSKKLRPVQAHQIPNVSTDFFDRNHVFADGFTNELRHGDQNAEQFKTTALEYYDEELKTMVIPETFIRHEASIPLNRWNPKTRYYVPGAAPGETEIGTGAR